MEEDTEAEEEAEQVPTHAAHQGEAQTETTTPTTAEPGIKGSCLPLQRPGRMQSKKTRSEVCFSVDRLTSLFSRTLILRLLLLLTIKVHCFYIANPEKL